MILSERFFSSGKALFFISPRETISPALPGSLREPGKFPISSKEERERELPDGSLARAISLRDSAQVRQVAADLRAWFTNHRPPDHQTYQPHKTGVFAGGLKSISVTSSPISNPSKIS